MMIGRDDTSNDVITHSMCFFLNGCLHSCLFLLCADCRNLTAQSMGSHWRIGGGIQILET